jgi:hypothetical protein
MFLRTEVLISQMRLRPQIANPQSVTFTEGPKSQKLFYFICEPLTLIAAVNTTTVYHLYCIPWRRSKSTTHFTCCVCKYRFVYLLLQSIS